MRIEIQFAVRKEEFPLDYRRIFISFLKTCISECNESKYMDKYYCPGKEKQYSFAVFFDNPQFMQDKIHLGGNKVKLVFSTADRLTGFIFYASFLEHRNRKFPLEDGNEMMLVNAKELKQQKITGTQVLLNIASPLCVRKHNAEKNYDYYYSYAHEEFETVFLYVVRAQLENAGFTEKYLEGFRIVPVSCKKVIVKHYESKIECTLGKIMLEGNPVILQYLLEAGLGSRKSAGFGLLELLSNG